MPRALSSLFSQLNQVRVNVSSYWGYLLVLFIGLVCTPVQALDQTNPDSCMASFNESRDRVLNTNTQSIILLSNSSNIFPFITLQSHKNNQDHYVLWQTLNGDIRGYALRNGKGFDYANNVSTPLPLSWHPTLIWDRLFGSNQKLNKFSCVLTGRTRVMGRRVSLLRLIPQDGLRYSYLVAKEDESDFPVELSIIDPRGVVTARLTIMDSRIIAGGDFPISDVVFDRIEESKLGHNSGRPHEQSDGKNEIASDPSSLTAVAASPASELADSNAISTLVQDQPSLESSTLDDSKIYGGEGGDGTSLELVLPKPTENVGATEQNSDKKTLQAQLAEAKVQRLAKLSPWRELNIPAVYNMVDEGKFLDGGNECLYQEFSDGLTSFRVYKNAISSIFYPVLNNGTLTIYRKNSARYEYSVVGEVPTVLAEFVLSHIRER